MLRIAAFVVDKRMLFFLIYIIAIIFSFFSAGWVSVENDIAAYLSDETETRQALDLMEREFVTFGTAKVMAANVTFDEAQKLCREIEKTEGVNQVEFTESSEEQDAFVKHYNNGSALFSVTFAYPEEDDRCHESLDAVKELLSSYDIYVSTSLGDTQAEIIEQEMQTIIVLVAVVVVAVLLFTCQSLGEVPVLLLTFLVSMQLNSGTNFLFGTISFVSNSVSSILQLALSVDYAIILCNRYKEERQELPVRDSAIIALSKSIPEICSSSLTTIGGLLALMFMGYKIGADLGIVLIKAIFLSLLSVFTLMPGLLVLFSGLMEKTKHKNLVPRISAVGRFCYATRAIVPVLFIAVFAAAFVYSQACPYVYSYSNIETPKLNSTQIADRMITENFGKENFVAVCLPGGNYRNESRFIQALEAMPEVDRCQGLANTEAMDGWMLTDALTPRQFSELIGLDYELAELVYSAYAAESSEYGRIIGGISSYRVPLMDMLMFVYEKVDEGYVTLDAQTFDTLSDAYTRISDGRKQLEGENYDRILVYLTLPEESEETLAFLDTIHEVAGRYYPDTRVYVVGNSTSVADLRTSFERDNIVVSVVSVLFVLVILLFTFKSAGMPLLLILIIEGAIFINFSFPTLMHKNLFFMGYLIVSSIQMGANIDYAIVISSRYLELRQSMGRRQSIVEALNFAFPTIITSGTMMILSGFAIGRMTSEPCITGIGECLGRGTTISVALVMLALPQILLIGDRIIEMTKFDISTPVRMREESGTIVVNGAIRGHINGTVVGTMNAVVRGDVRAVVISGGMEKREEKRLAVVDAETGGESDVDIAAESEADPAAEEAESGIILTDVEHIEAGDADASEE